jgi:nucleotide-binding universal stress UspA family protein
MKIVYGTDGSPGALAAADFLKALRLTPDDRVLVLGADRERGAEWAREAAEALAGSGVTTEERVSDLSAAEAILNVAREEQADLILMGAMGSGGLIRFLIGSTTERVLRHAETTVLIGRPVRHGLARVLVGVDGSNVAPRVTSAAAALPLPANTDLRLATALPAPEAVAGAAPLVWASLGQELERAMQDELREAEARLRDLGQPLQAAGRNVHAEILRGEAASALLAAVERENADLLVVGSHGEGGMDRFLLGSVSERVARHAPCSVMVVR